MRKLLKVFHRNIHGFYFSNPSIYSSPPGYQFSENSPAPPPNYSNLPIIRYSRVAWVNVESELNLRYENINILKQLHSQRCHEGAVPQFNDVSRPCQSIALNHEHLVSCYYLFYTKEHTLRPRISVSPLTFRKVFKPPSLIRAPPIKFLTFLGKTCKKLVLLLR